MPANMLLQVISTILFAAQAIALPKPANTNVNPNAIINTTCTAPGV